MLQFFQVLVGVMAQPEVAYPWSDTCRWILWLAWPAMTPKLQLFPVPGSGGHCCLDQPKPSMSVGALVWLRHAPQFPHSKAPHVTSVPTCECCGLVQKDSRNHSFPVIHVLSGSHSNTSPDCLPWTICSPHPNTPPWGLGLGVHKFSIKQAQNACQLLVAFRLVV